LREDEYKQKHTTANCSCTLIHAPQAIMEAIRRGPRNSIPLITPYRTTQSGTVTYVQLVDSEQTSSFVAISHVWSDGLGNSEKNAIPRCQFDRLSDLVSRLFDGQPQPFWLDTLCFPLGLQDIYDLALIRIHKSYADAHKVLLLDHYLLSANRIGMSDEEMMAMLFCSPWNRRLWTLQEGFLAKSLVIQFADTHIDILEWFDRENDNDTKAEFGHLTFNNIWVSFESLRASERGPSFVKPYDEHSRNEEGARLPLYQHEGRQAFVPRESARLGFRGDRSGTNFRTHAQGLGAPGRPFCTSHFLERPEASGRGLSLGTSILP
jgi:hypothetical protein